jgi:hypothetical protein
MTAATSPARSSESSPPIALVDLLDRLLGTGVVLAGDITISLSGVDLVHVQLHALITSVRADMDRRADSQGRGDAGRPA